MIAYVTDRGVRKVLFPSGNMMEKFKCAVSNTFFRVFRRESQQMGREPKFRLLTTHVHNFACVRCSSISNVSIRRHYHKQTW